MAGRYAVRRAGGAVLLSDRETRAEARLEPRRGGNVVRFRVARPGGGRLDLLVPPRPPRGLGAVGVGAGLPVLFPFPNRVARGRYDFDGAAFRLRPDPRMGGHHIHGLAGRLPWRLEAFGAGRRGAWARASLDLSDFPAATRAYPFPCRLAVTTRLADGALVHEAEATNLGRAPLPMGYGLHPWFPSALDGTDRRRTEIRVGAAARWDLRGCLPTGRIRPVGGGRFDLRRGRPLGVAAYDDVFTRAVRRADGWTEAAVRYPEAGLEIRIEADAAFREWVVYAPRHRRVVCLEPYTCTTNAVNLSPRGVDAGLVVLPPGGRWRGRVRISLL